MTNKECADKMIKVLFEKKEYQTERHLSRLELEELFKFAFDQGLAEGVRRKDTANQALNKLAQLRAGFHGS